MRRVEAAAGTEDEGLPTTWCGTERTTDDTADAAFPQQTQQFKLVYAYASDRRAASPPGRTRCRPTCR